VGREGWEEGEDIANCKLQIAICKLGNTDGNAGLRIRAHQSLGWVPFNLQFAICNLQFAMS
jgi:hypothetical protein